MIVTYEFNANDEDDREDLKIFLQAKNMYMGIWDFLHRFDIDDIENKSYEDAITEFWAAMEKNQVDIDV